MSILRYTPNHTPLKYRGPIKMSNRSKEKNINIKYDQSCKKLTCMLPIRNAKRSSPMMMMRMVNMISHTNVLTESVWVKELEPKIQQNKQKNMLVNWSAIQNVKNIHVLDRLTFPQIANLTKKQLKVPTISNVHIFKLLIDHSSQLV